jgi:AcrR family transcriptional regulator
VSGVKEDGRLARGARTRTAVLDAAVALATESGLDGLSLGELAERLGVSKSGLFAHWRSKEDLQLAAVDRASEQWVERIIAPALHHPRGVRRLWALHDSRLAFYESGTLPGGCFFAAADIEFVTRTGPVRARLVEALHDWLGLIERLATEAVTAGELVGIPSGQIAFEVNAAGTAAVYQARLSDPAAAYRYARRAVLDRLRAACPSPTLLPEAAP